MSGLIVAYCGCILLVRRKRDRRIAAILGANQRRRPFLLNALALADWHISKNAAALIAVQEVWNEDGTRKVAVA